MLAGASAGGDVLHSSAGGLHLRLLARAKRELGPVDFGSAGRRCALRAADADRPLRSGDRQQVRRQRRAGLPGVRFPQGLWHILNPNAKL